MKKLIYFLLALSVFSCRKDFEDTTIIEEHYTPPVIKVNGSLLGRVIDENFNPVNGATVRLGANAVTTGEFGYFRFEDKVLNAAGTFVSVEMAGYFQGSDRFFPKANTQNYTTIQLLPKTIVGTVSGVAGGEVSLSDGAIVRLPAGGIMDASGQIYAGDVQIAAQWLNPKADNLGDFMPGNLQGVSEAGEEMALASYGMIAVELSSPSGEILNVATGQKATLEFPIVSELSAGAPQEIPLWYFDETVGIWVEEGKAIRNGERYIGEVAHFSFWNCDAPFTLVNLSGTLVDANGDPLANRSVEIQIVSSAISGYGYSDGTGYFGGKVPKDEAMTLIIRDNCGDVVVSQNIGPFSDDVDLGTIVVEYDAQDLVEISGTLVDCDGNPVAGGLIQIQWGNWWAFFLEAEDDGSFSWTTLVCDETTYSITGIDLVNQLQSAEYTGTVPGAADLGTISTCVEELDEYIRVTYDGIEYEYLLPQAYGQGPFTSVDVFSLDSSFAVSFTFAGNTVGTFPLDESRFFYFDVDNIPAYSFYCAGSCVDFEVAVTEYGAVGEKIIGSFEGTIDRFDINQTSTPVPISGTFKVDRE